MPDRFKWVDDDEDDEPPRSEADITPFRLYQQGQRLLNRIKAFEKAIAYDRAAMQPTLDEAKRTAASMEDVQGRLRLQETKIEAFTRMEAKLQRIVDHFEQEENKASQIDIGTRLALLSFVGTLVCVVFGPLLVAFMKHLLGLPP